MARPMTLRESIRGLVSDPSLRDRLLWRDPMRAETMITEDRGLIARTYGTLFSLGGVAGLILLASGRATEDADWALAAASLGYRLGDIGVINPVGKGQDEATDQVAHLAIGIEQAVVDLSDARFGAACPGQQLRGSATFGVLSVEHHGYQMFAHSRAGIADLDVVHPQFGILADYDS